MREQDRDAKFLWISEDGHQLEPEMLENNMERLDDTLGLEDG